MPIRVAAVVLVIVIAAAALTVRHRFVMPFSDAEVETALRDNGQSVLLYLSAAVDQGKDGMTMGFDTWWRLCEGRWTQDVQEFLPGVTDVQLGKFLKRYGQAQRGKDPRSLIKPDERPAILFPGERTFTVTLNDFPNDIAFNAEGTTTGEVEEAGLITYLKSMEAHGFTLDSVRRRGKSGIFVVEHRGPDETILR
jgi:hypothetical protein